MKEKIGFTKRKIHIYRIGVLPLAKVPNDVIQEYWQSLYMEGWLDSRLCDVDNPTWSDVVEMIVRMGSQMYCVMDSDKMVAEFMLENFTGRAAQIHFSCSPRSTPQMNLYTAREASRIILEEWKGPDGPYLDTLYGLTPVTNRVACIFTLKVGFKKIGILPNGMRDRGKIVNAMISTKVRNGR